MPVKQSRIERGKQAILEMVDKVFPEITNQEVLLLDGNNRNVTQKYLLVFPERNNIELDVFEKKISEYFEPHICYGRRRMLSYVKCLTSSIIDNDTETNLGQIVAEIEIRYFKEHIPYPSLESLGQVRDLLTVAQIQIQITKKENSRLIKKNNRLIDDTNRYMKNMRKVISSLYESSIQKQDCPTCWEEITVEKLYITRCGHFICSDCKGKLAKAECPLCRESLGTNINH
jgi:ribosomal protein L37AE/L43A